MQYDKLSAIEDQQVNSAVKLHRTFLVAAAILIALDAAVSAAQKGHALLVANTALCMITIGILCAVLRRQRKTRERYSPRSQTNCDVPIK